MMLGGLIPSKDHGPGDQLQEKQKQKQFSKELGVRVSHLAVTLPKTPNVLGLFEPPGRHTTAVTTFLPK